MPITHGRYLACHTVLNTSGSKLIQGIDKNREHSFYRADNLVTGCRNMYVFTQFKISMLAP